MFVAELHRRPLCSQVATRTSDRAAQGLSNGTRKVAQALVLALRGGSETHFSVVGYHLATHRRLTACSPAPLFLVRSACYFTSLLQVGSAAACSVERPRRCCYGVQQMQHADAVVAVGVNLLQIVMKRARPNCSMATLALGPCIACKSGKSRFHWPSHQPMIPALTLTQA